VVSLPSRSCLPSMNLGGGHAISGNRSRSSDLALLHFLLSGIQEWTAVVIWPTRPRIPYLQIEMAFCASRIPYLASSDLGLRAARSSNEAPADISVSASRVN
jgi:hypothetical protein